MKYRPEIDGLRALAVLPVIFFHAGMQSFSGGYVGVDVFFVISGFLITGIIRDELAKGRFSLVNFYERRARRILPALFFFVFLATPFAFWIMPPHTLKEYFQSVLSVSLFVSNIFFYIKTDYFNDFSEIAPLLHTWSLSVEEQFYLVFPLLLMLLKRLRTAWMMAVAFILSVLSLLAAQYELPRDASFAFYQMPTRFWELGVGAMLSMGMAARPLALHARVSSALAALGVGMIVVPMVFYTKLTPFPGVAALSPVLGAALIILCTQQRNLVQAVLASRPLVWVGLVSYSLYLSHNIVFAIARNLGFHFDDWAVRLVSMAISLALAMLSYRFVEQPFRSRRIGRAGIFSFSLAGLIGLFALGYAGHVHDGFKLHIFSRIDASQRHLLIDLHREFAARQQLWSNLLSTSDRPFEPDGPVRKLLILGDSKSEDWYVAYAVNPFDKGLQVRRLRLDDACMDSAVSSTQADVCQHELGRALSSPLLAQADTIVLSSTWQSETNDGVRAFVGTLLAMHKRVKIVSTANFSDVSSLSYVLARGGVAKEAEPAFYFKNIRADWERQYHALRAGIQQDTPGVIFIDKLDAFCDQPRSSCQLRDEAGWYLFDTGHVTVHGAHFLNSRMSSLHWFD